jgi:broad specificity phosphatase PhoE
VNDIKEPSAKATVLGGKFYSEVWRNGGREIAGETIRLNEEEAHRASEEARRAAEAVERERHIGMFVSHSIFVSALASYLTKLHFM